MYTEKTSVFSCTQRTTTDSVIITFLSVEIVVKSYLESRFILIPLGEIILCFVDGFLRYRLYCELPLSVLQKGNCDLCSVHTGESGE